MTFPFVLLAEKHFPRTSPTACSSLEERWIWATLLLLPISQPPIVSFESHSKEVASGKRGQRDEQGQRPFTRTTGRILRVAVNGRRYAATEGVECAATPPAEGTAATAAAAAALQN